MFFSCFNFILFFAISLFIGTKSKVKNAIISFAFALFIVLEIVSFSFFNDPIGGNFIFYSINLKIFKIASTTKLLAFYFGILTFFAIFFLYYFILSKFQIIRYKRLFFLSFFVFQLSPLGFIYSIFYDMISDYKIYYDYKKYSYNDIFKIAKGIDYVDFDNLEIKNSNRPYKNLVMIYMESYDQSLLENEYTSKYTKNINGLIKDAEYIKDMEQLYGTMGTIPGIITSQCGAQYNSFFLFKNPYSEVKKNTLFVCLSDVLYKAGYYQIFIGGANKQIVNKGNFLYSHKFDKVEDEISLTRENGNLKNNLVEWGVSDYDVFERAKKEYTKLSENIRPFNLTLLTTATHNYNGSFDKRCPNSADKKLLNAVECTDYLVENFLNFLKTQDNFKDTLIVILPDHIQYEANELNGVIKSNKKRLYTIILNSDNKNIISGKTNYTDLAELLLKKLNVESNVVFLKRQEDISIIKNFIYKIHNR